VPEVCVLVGGGLPARRARRAGALRRLAGAAAGLVVAGLLAALPVAGAHAGEAASCVGECTISQDTLRTGWDDSEPELSPSDVQEPDFGQLFDTQLPPWQGNATTGPTPQQIYAQPLVADGYLVVATEENNVYGLDPQTGAVDWSINLGPSWPASTISCGDLVPDIGVTSTPVYDPTTQTLYVMAKTWAADVDSPMYQLSAISLVGITGGTAQELAGWPVTIAGDPTDSPGLPFQAERQLQRPGLLLLDGVVYAGFGSQCDLPNYTGYVAGVDTTTAQMSTLWSAMPGYQDVNGDANGGGGIWQGGGGLVNVAGSDNIYLATGNGALSPSADMVGTSVTGATPLSETVTHLQVQVQPNGSLTPVDFFSPLDNTKLNNDDTDLGSGGPMAIPAGYPSTSSPPLIVQDGKDGRVWLLNQNDLGGTEETSPGSGVNAVVDQIGPYGGVWGHPAFFGGDDGYVYYDTAYGPLIDLKLGVTAGGTPTIGYAGGTQSDFGYTSGSPVVTSDGTADSSAVVWLVDVANTNQSASGTDANLQAYSSTPNGQGYLTLLNQWPIRTEAKFTTPATYDGRVYVGTRDGNVFSFGAPTGAPLMAAPLNFGENPVGTPVQGTVTVTATAASITIYGATSTGPFTTDVSIPSGGDTLTQGQTLAIPVTYTPTVGQSSGSLVLDTHDDTSDPKVSVALSGIGTRTGLDAYPTSLDFGQVPTGGTVRDTVQITNTGTSSFTVTKVTVPGKTSPFAVTGLPTDGHVIGAQKALTANVAYSPTSAPGPFTGDIEVAGTSAGSTHSTTVKVSGTSIVGHPHLTIRPTTVNYGTVQLATTVKKTFELDNTGNINIVISKAAPPSGEFTVLNLVGEGSTIDAGNTVVVTVAFTPTRRGPASGIYTFNAADGQGPQLVHFTGAGPEAPGTVRHALSRDATVGRLYRGRFAATAYPRPTYRVHSGSLPPGLVLHRVTGVLIGRPTRAGTYRFTVVAANPSGSRRTAILTIVVRRS
jgi:outer membrane protein assembly factor BamB